MHNCLAGGKKPPGIAISLGIAQIDYHVMENFVRSVKAKSSRVADIEFDYPETFFLKPFGFPVYPSPNIVTNIFEF